MSSSIYISRNGRTAVIEDARFVGHPLDAAEARYYLAERRVLEHFGLEPPTLAYSPSFDYAWASLLVELGWVIDYADVPLPVAGVIY